MHYNVYFHGISYIFQITEELSPILLRISERDLSLKTSDMLLPPLDQNDDQGQKNGGESTNKVKNDDEYREKQRIERKCSCKNLGKCRHFLTYDLFEVCLAFQEVFSKRKALMPVDRKTLLLTNSYHDWFMPSFAAWLAVVSEQVRSIPARTNAVVRQFGKSEQTK